MEVKTLMFHEGLKVPGIKLRSSFWIVSIIIL